jgi:hypothetical protein
MKNRRLPDETRPDDMSSKMENGKSQMGNFDECCDHDEPKQTGGVCSVDGKCCQEGSSVAKAMEDDKKVCCGDDCECEK